MFIKMARHACLQTFFGHSVSRDGRERDTTKEALTAAAETAGRETTKEALTAAAETAAEKSLEARRIPEGTDAGKEL